MHLRKANYEHVQEYSIEYDGSTADVSNCQISAANEGRSCTVRIPEDALILTVFLTGTYPVLTPAGIFFRRGCDWSSVCVL